MPANEITPFSEVYAMFLPKITEDLYMEWTREETIADMQNILLSAIPDFEFPRVPLFNYDLDYIDGTEEEEEEPESGSEEPEDGGEEPESGSEESESESEENGEGLEDEVPVDRVGAFLCKLSLEEKDILAHIMVIKWFSRQIASIDNIRMKYSGSDFRFTSQANHLDKLLKMKRVYEAESIKRQRLYKRRKVVEGMVSTNYSGLSGGVIR